LRVVNGKPLGNFWGYSTVGFFAPQSAYCMTPETGSHLEEFRDLVKALHKAGIEIILDVVFNHTDEGNDQGPVFSFKGIDNGVYYFLSPSDNRSTSTTRVVATRSTVTNLSHKNSLSSAC